MRLAAVLAVLMFTAGSALACPMHEQSASNGQYVAQNAKKPQQSHPDSNG